MLVEDCKNNRLKYLSLPKTAPISRSNRLRNF